MLPIETFAEAVAFLRLYDLKELAVANRRCSKLATEHAAKIRVQTFPALCFQLHDKSVTVENKWTRVAHFDFPSELATAEFVSAAFRNCVFENVRIPFYPGKHIMNAIAEVTGSVVITGELYLGVDTLTTLRSAPEIIDFVARFRSLKALKLLAKLTDGDLNELSAFCRKAGIRELYYGEPSWHEWKNLLIV